MRISFKVVVFTIVTFGVYFSHQTHPLARTEANFIQPEEIMPTYNRAVTQWKGVVHIHYLSFEDLQKELKKNYPTETREVLGFKINDKDQVCHIYVMKPEYVNDDRTRTMGHELLHCVHGPYHF